MANKDSLNYKATLHQPIDEKDDAKNKLILGCADQYINHHITALATLPKQKWEYEKQYTFWTKEINVYWNGYIDLEGSTHFVDLKNVFGAVRKTKKGYSLDSKKVPVKPYHSDLMQMSLYRKMCEKIPVLIYASNADWKCFTPDNCNELKDENLDIHFKELVTIQKTWQNKLQVANGDIKKLAGLIKPDFSNIRKKDFWWETVPPEFIKKFRGIYDC